ncbi:hypothetical protein CHS0354_038764 [Potamilus streckersoni]|uniref:Uncharacterized protein n=1 Tax=Potamilus streckersoni TaxID=2493646 RepID=A0AAE0SS56_9BIVA|nr:hypothetical protein CHS0354_038764 [Potamilus streckersoni]
MFEPHTSDEVCGEQWTHETVKMTVAHLPVLAVIVSPVGLCIKMKNTCAGERNMSKYRQGLGFALSAEITGVMFFITDNAFFKIDSISTKSKTRPNKRQPLNPGIPISSGTDQSKEKINV